MKRLPVVLISLFFSAGCLAQVDSVSCQRIFAEAGGNGGLWSLNYEWNARKILPEKLRWEVGFSIVPYANHLIVDFPFSVNFIFGKRTHKAELGTGQVFMLDIGGGKGGFIRGAFHAGYRFEAPGRRFFYKIAYTPFYSYLFNFQYEHWFGAGIGYQIK